ncbi:MAG: protein phosphatase [Actinomycetota bacterium]|nr:protein phosphatase [Actinomycetota bacterium]
MTDAPQPATDGRAWPPGPGVVVLPDGRSVRCRGLRHPSPAQPPEVGFYLLSEPPSFDWATDWIDWPDFRLPKDPERAIEQLRDAHARCADERVELACNGGIGRTGTALAVLAVLSGVAPGEAVRWARTHYEPRASETPWQRRWVRRLDL